MLVSVKYQHDRGCATCSKRLGRASSSRPQYRYLCFLSRLLRQITTASSGKSAHVQNPANERDRLHLQTEQLKEYIPPAPKEEAAPPRKEDAHVHHPQSNTGTPTQTTSHAPSPPVTRSHAALQPGPSLLGGSSTCSPRILFSWRSHVGSVASRVLKGIGSSLSVLTVRGGGPGHRSLSLLGLPKVKI